MSKPALKDCEDMPSNPNEKRVSARSAGTSAFVRGGKGKGKKGRRKHMKK